MPSSGGIYITNNAATILAPLALTKVTGTSWWNNYGLGHGDNTVKEDATNGRLLLRSGTYRLNFSASVEGAAVGTVEFELRKNGVTIPGSRSYLTLVGATSPNTVAATALVDVLAADAVSITAGGAATGVGELATPWQQPNLTQGSYSQAATAAIEVYVGGVGVGSGSGSGDTITITEAQLVATLVN